MKSRLAIGFTIAAVAALGLSACSTDADDATTAVATSAAAVASETAEASSPEPSAEVAEGIALTTLETALGTIVVDGDGMTIYQFDSDTQGAGVSTCVDACAANWPAVPGTEAASLTGITGEVGTITAADGNPQLTLNGWPLYYFVKDAAPGDVNGQGVNGVWWVLTPEGERVTS